MKSIEGGDGREVKRTLQAVKGRCLQLLRMVRDDVAGNEERYSEEQLPGIKSSAQTLKEKCKLVEKREYMEIGRE